MSLPEPSYAVASNPLYNESDPLSVLFAGRSQTRALHQAGPKIYDYYLLHYIESGRGLFRTERRTYALGPGDCFLIHPARLVSYVSDREEPWRYRWMAFAGAEADRLVAGTGFSPDHPVVSAGDNSVIPGALAGIMEAFGSARESGGLTALGHLYLTLGEAAARLAPEERPARPDSRAKRTVMQMIHYMTSQYAHPVSMEDMSASLGYNRAYLSRIFKAETGYSPVTYLLKLRIDRSRRLLRERPELSVEQVAASVGLNDPMYFSRQFKRFCGESPSHYRASVSGR